MPLSQSVIDSLPQSVAHKGERKWNENICSHIISSSSGAFIQASLGGPPALLFVTSLKGLCFRLCIHGHISIFPAFVLFDCVWGFFFLLLSGREIALRAMT